MSRPSPGVMTAAAQALDAHAALRTHALVERLEDYTAALQTYQACLEVLVDSVHSCTITPRSRTYEKLATVKAVLEHLEADAS
jgi:hypothetical protein